MLATAGVAAAAAPGNDTYSGRTVAGSLPFTETLDTTEATTDADDVELMAAAAPYCGGTLTTDASVWYQVTTPDGGIDLDMQQSSYAVAAAVVTGSPGNWAGVTCGFGRVGWSAEAGATYTILIFDSQFDGGGNGGTLSFTLDNVIDVTADRSGTFVPATGVATVSGTGRCRAGESGFIETHLSQVVGRIATITGTGGAPLVCDGEAHPWTTEIFPVSGKFAGGQATLAVFGLLDASLAADIETVTVVLHR